MVPVLMVQVHTDRNLRDMAMVRIRTLSMGMDNPRTPLIRILPRAIMELLPRKLVRRILLNRDMVVTPPLVILMHHISLDSTVEPLQHNMVEALRLIMAVVHPKVMEHLLHKAIVGDILAVLLPMELQRVITEILLQVITNHLLVVHSILFHRDHRPRITEARLGRLCVGRRT